jgi:hypothetical protein
MIRISFIALMALSLPAHAEGQQIKGSAITDALLGKTFRLVKPKTDSDIRHVYLPDGKIDYVVDGVANPGTWVVQNDQMCWSFTGMDKPDCWTVIIDGTSLALMMESGFNWGLEEVKP